jgi:hypothetical protein
MDGNYTKTPTIIVFGSAILMAVLGGQKFQKEMEKSTSRCGSQ